MGHLPILKSREVVALLEALGFTELRQRGSPSSSATLMVDVQQCHFMQGVTYRQSYLNKSQKILD